MKGKMKRFKRMPRRIVSLLLTVVMIALMFPAFELTVHAQWYEYELDGHPYYVDWDEDAWGEGTAVMECMICGLEMQCDFYDFDREGAAYQLLSAIFGKNQCDHCVQCVEMYHCSVCEGCFEEDTVPCDGCNSLICLNCHYESYFCDLCGDCRIDYGGDGTTMTGHNDLGLPNIDVLCEDCISSIEYCACGNVLTIGGDYILADEIGEDWCEECRICHACYTDASVLAEHGHCINCQVCPFEEVVCEDCGLCTNCAEGFTHCPECEECFAGDVIWCPYQEDAHCFICCLSNDWICERCEVCLGITGGEKCPDCGLCVDCCLEISEEEGCTHGYCVYSSDYQDHVCVECGECPQDKECDYCGRCENCIEDYHCEHEICPENDLEWEEHLCDSCGECFELDELCEYCHMCAACNEHCDKHDLCPEDGEYDDHFCDNCGDCFEEDEFCEYCGLCLDCCEDIASFDYGCDHGICVESPDFDDHYCFEDEQCREECNHPEDCDHLHLKSGWETNYQSHWRVCSDCGTSTRAAAHTVGKTVTVTQPNPQTRTNGVAKNYCGECGAFMYKSNIPYTAITTDGSPCIVTQPKDYNGRISKLDYCEEDEFDPRYASFVVEAYGDDLKYQWFIRVNGGSWKALSDKIGNEDIYDIKGKPEVYGSKTPHLTVLVPGESCYVSYEYFCRVSNAKAIKTTRTAKMNSQHYFGYYDSHVSQGHTVSCYGFGCDATLSGMQEHRMGNWYVDYPATTERNGQMSSHCVDCYYTEYAPIFKIEPEHTHEFKRMNNNSAYHWYECWICGKKTTEIAHLYGDWTVTKEPTETRTGLRTRKCFTCQYIESEAIDTLPHTHNFTALKDKKAARYDLPNGKADDAYHYRFCTGCTSYEKEAHTYGAWQLINKPYTSNRGTYHRGTIGRSCYVCGHNEQKKFDDTGKYPVLVEVIGGSSDSGFGGANVTGPVCADPGTTVTLTVTFDEGYVGDKWSLDEVTSTDGTKVDGKWMAFKNSSIKRGFSYDKNTFTCTLVMPNGPVALALIVDKCSHSGYGVYNDTIAASCTGYGSNVMRCTHCKGVVRTMSRIAPAGHRYRFHQWIEDGSCDTLAVYWEKCIDCGNMHKRTDGYRHNWQELHNEVPASCFSAGHKQDLQCRTCGEYLKGERIPAYGSHKWGEWETIREATTAVKGQRSHECLRCGTIQTESTDYAGTGYALKPDTTTVHFDFTFGDKVAPKTVNYTSVGRNKITQILSIDDQDETGYDYQVTGDMQISFKPLQADMVYLEAMGKKFPFALWRTKEAGNGDFTVPDIVVSSNIKFPEGRYNFSVEGAKFRVWDKQLQAWGTKWYTSRDLPAGTIVQLQPDDAAGFKGWTIEQDRSGIIDELFNQYNWYNQRGASLVTPPNKAKVSVESKTITSIELPVLTKPVVGATTNKNVKAPADAPYYVFDVLWRTGAGRTTQSVTTYEAGKSYYALIYVKPEDGYTFDADALENAVHINGVGIRSNGLVTSGRYEGCYSITTMGMTAITDAVVKNVAITIPEPKIGERANDEVTVSGEGVALNPEGVNVIWRDMTDPDDIQTMILHRSVFQEGHTYAAVVGITAEDGYRFGYSYGDDTSILTRVTVNGAVLDDTKAIWMDDNAMVGYIFTPLSEQYLLGDVNGNEEVDTSDATFIQRTILNIDTPIGNKLLKRGDVTDTGELDLLDVTTIQYYLADLKTPYKVGKQIWTNR